MKTTRWLAPVIFLALSVGGCGSSPPVQYYDLESLETGYIDDGETFLRVGVGPLRTPDYLSRSQIVTRGKDSTVIVNDFNRWIEPLDGSTPRITAMGEGEGFSRGVILVIRRRALEVLTERTIVCERERDGLRYEDVNPYLKGL